MSGETILVVDDSSLTREFIVDYVLKPKGYRAMQAIDGAEGLRLAREHKPDLIILDMEMPKLDGMGVLRALKESGLNFPVIMSTAHGSEQIASRSLSAGCARLRPQAL